MNTAKHSLSLYGYIYLGRWRHHIVLCYLPGSVKSLPIWEWHLTILCTEHVYSGSVFIVGLCSRCHSAWGSVLQHHTFGLVGLTPPLVSHMSFYLCFRTQFCDFGSLMSWNLPWCLDHAMSRFPSFMPWAYGEWMDGRMNIFLINIQVEYLLHRGSSRVLFSACALAIRQMRPDYPMSNLKLTRMFRNNGSLLHRSRVKVSLPSILFQ